MIEELRRLITIIELHSFTKAAQVLHVTQPALSISIKNLENHMHAKIFHRKLKQLTLTEEGKIIYQLGKKMMLQWDNLRDPKFRSTLIGKEHIVIGTFDSGAITLAPLFNKYSKNDAFVIDLVIDDSHTLYNQFALGMLDICICVLPMQNPHNELSLQLAYTYQEYLIPVAKTPKWNRSSLSDIPFILYANHSTTREYINDYFLQNSIAPKIIAESTSTSFMKALVSLGQGVAFLPKSVIAQDTKNGKLSNVNLRNHLSRQIGIYVKNSSLTTSPLFTQITSLLK